MAKIKNKKRTSDRIISKKEDAKFKKKLNPFEVHVNKEKLRILGRKQKNEKGLPGISRSKAIQKRKATLLQEYKFQNKANKFMDKRIGERNFTMSEEDKTMARYTAVRVKTHKKKSIFNLADDEVLTHRGQTLSEIEKFDDPRSDDDDEGIEDKGKLDSNFVEAHFGGGLLKKTGSEGVKSHKQLIEELIAESKKRKAEQQKMKEATLELTEKLDTEWKDLMPLLNKRSEEIQPKKTDIDDYDKVMRELRFEARGIVSDRLKTIDELAKEEKEKLEQLETERQQRMQGFVENNLVKPNHRSADDLEDDIIYEDDPNYMLSYNNEGESNIKITANIEKNKLNSEADNQEDDNNESESDDDLSESEDDLSDLKVTDSESENEDKSEQQTNNICNLFENKINNPCGVQNFEKNDTIPEKINNSQASQNGDDKEKISEIEQLKADLLKRKEMMDKARAELPYTFSLPSSYESLHNVFLNQSSNHKNIIIERMIKCNHPSLKEGNKEKLGLLFAYLLQYINDSFIDYKQKDSLKNSFEVFKALIPQIYDLAVLNPENTHNSMLEVIKEKQEEYRKNKSKYPGLEVLVFLKLISVLFSTSDFRHQIVTPSLIFIEQMLTNCKIRTKRDISYGLFLTTLVTEYTAISKRYLPAAVNFLSGLLHMAVPKNSVKLIRALPPFKSTSSLLVLLKKCDLPPSPLKMVCADLIDAEIEEDFKIKALNTSIKLLEEMYNNFKDLPSNVEIFEPVLKYLELIPLTNYPEEVSGSVVKFIESQTRTIKERKLDYLVMEAMKPKALRLYEPKIIQIYDGKRRHKIQSKEKAELEKLQHKVKREKKGALREIRRDNAFLGRVKVKQQIQSDKERRDKVKRIYSEAAAQQHELNAIDRKKKRKR